MHARERVCVCMYVCVCVCVRDFIPENAIILFAVVFSDYVLLT